MIIITLVALLLTACNPTPTPGPTALPDPRALVTEAMRATRATDGFRLIIERGGAPVYIDQLNTIEFLRAQGQFVLPDQIQTTVKIKLAGVVGQAELVAAGLDQYLSHTTLTGGVWFKFIFLPGFDPGTMLAEGGGLERALTTVKDLGLVGVEAKDGTEAYHLRGVGVGADVAAFTLGLVASYDVEVDAWIDVATKRVVHLEVVENNRPLPEGETEPPVWTVELYDYNDAGLAVEIPEDAVEPESTPTLVPTANPAGTGS
ncbi:MAG: LppX_LprAFG lipoprotein [Anaerolineae bacterium]|nr:LppX_LprAFG lipoprotein [Anaerolineae bacterium]